MNSVVLDASAVMTVINSEPGADKLTPQILSKALTSTVNLAEVHGKLIHRGFSPDDAWAAANGTIHEVVAFTAEHAKTAGDLVIQTRALGLSLGDRACLALAIAVQAAVYTADRSWKNLNVGVRIHVIR
ncbi:MAG: type II toxin-antitoxin system VapC family toxin [Acidobacteriia bacterium]|nr:type II toxin-antitoxin system VapC family toxin [Terriglobia bacterium]